MASFVGVHAHDARTALKLEEIFRKAGLPDGVLNIITGYGETTGAALTAQALEQLIPRLDQLMPK